MSTITNFLSKFRTWKETKTTSIPLTAESAYTLSAIKQDTTLVVVYDKYKKQVLDAIKNTAKYTYGNTELYIKFPEHVVKGHKEQLKEDLERLGYTIPHFSNTSIIINWETE